MPDEPTSDFNAESEIKIVKAFSAINQDIVQRETNLLVKEIEKLPIEKKLKSYAFYQSLAYADYEPTDQRLESIINILKAINFLKFIKQKYPIHLSNF